MTPAAKFVGALCVMGHDDGYGRSIRYVSTGKCTRCQRVWTNTNRLAEAARLLQVSASQGRHDGRYTAPPCKLCGGTERIASGNKCVGCRANGIRRACMKRRLSAAATDSNRDSSRARKRKRTIEYFDEDLREERALLYDLESKRRALNKQLNGE